MHMSLFFFLARIPAAQLTQLKLQTATLVHLSPRIAEAIDDCNSRHYLDFCFRLKTSGDGTESLVEYLCTR